MENLGNIILTKNVIKDIVVEAIKSVDHVVGISNSKKDMMSFFKSNNEIKSFFVELGESECVVELPLILEYGCNIKDVATQVQKTVSETIQELAGIKVREINITIEKIEPIRKEEIVEDLSDSIVE